jgi:tetratricopeptide (TPR) repeat protein
MGDHADSDQASAVYALEATIDPERSPVEDLVRLGLLYIEPCHREDDAIILLEAALKRVPGHACAKIWLAYCCIHHLLDEAALARARRLMESVLEAGSDERGAAYLLLAEAGRDLGDLPLTEEVALLEASVQQEPGWVSNRESLAWVYAQTGRRADALAQLRAALRNIRPLREGAGVAEEMYEQSITGRASHRARERILAQLVRIEAAQSG